jgi:hypothetical protein
VAGDLFGFSLLALATFLWPLLRGERLSPAQAREVLAERLAQQWKEDENRCRLNDPYPLPVSWDVTDTAAAAMLYGDRERAYRWPRRYVYAATLIAIAVLVWWLLP